MVEKSALAHYKTYARQYTLPDGPGRRLMRSWTYDHISRRMKQAYESSVREIERTAKAARPHRWPMHDTKLPDKQYLGHVQPWMRALCYENAVKAANAALEEIDRREGLTGTARPPFHSKVPRLPDPDIKTQPCQCKEDHAMNIAHRVLDSTMTELRPYISTLSTSLRSRDRAAMQCEEWNTMEERIQTAMLNALAEIIEPGDVGHLCSGHGMTHVQPWMSQTIEEHCHSAAKAQSKIVRWKIRDVNIRWFQDWLEMLYRQDAADDLTTEDH